jgi:hypothetical protein
MICRPSGVNEGMNGRVWTAGRVALDGYPLTLAIGGHDPAPVRTGGDGPGADLRGNAAISAVRCPASAASRSITETSSVPPFAANR